MNERIEHSGLIERITGDKVEVKILQSSACSACTARNLCNTAESKEKIIECRRDGTDYRVGEKVTVYGSTAMGKSAVVLAFVVPLMLTVVWMFAAINLIGLSELSAAGGLALILAAYYTVLHMLNGLISKKFEFWIEKIV